MGNLSSNTDMDALDRSQVAAGALSRVALTIFRTEKYRPLHFEVERVCVCVCVCPSGELPYVLETFRFVLPFIVFLPTGALAKQSFSRLRQLHGTHFIGDDSHTAIPSDTMQVE